ncbi:MAG: FAD synthetase [Chloroflexi bacterium]|nr:MAG: FAD synthetase [Chloroflexota bacterium]
MRSRQLSLFDNQRLRLDGAVEMSLDSLAEYGSRYRHWAVAYSGGKDSSAVVTLVAWAIKTGRIPAPESLTVLYADTRMELPPLQQTAMQLLAVLANDGFDTRVVLPEIDKRFYVYMLGYGVPPPSNTFRWCTGQIKVKPMEVALKKLRKADKFLMITGVRLGESAQRDQRIALSCSRDSGECGQGWFQTMSNDAVADTLAPLLHWRVCFVWDWLYFGDHGFPVVQDIATVYGESDDVRTGCVGCNLASRDVATTRLTSDPEWAHLRPLLELKPLYAELKKPRWRKRKIEPELRKDGLWAKNVQRMGPLTMEGRAYGLERVRDIQARASVDLINAEEEARIREMWRLDVWPQKWSAADADATLPIDALSLSDNGQIVTQALLIR